MDEAILEFTAEAREGLEALDSAMVAFERTPDDPRLLGDVFRLAHSLKGASGFLGLVRLQALTHAAENLLGAFRDGELAVSAQAVSLILETMDRVRLIVEALERDGAEPDGEDRDLIARLDAALATGAPPAQTSQPGHAPPADLLHRLGGEAALDAAVEMALSQWPPVMAWPLEAQLRLQADLRHALTEAARGATPIVELAVTLDARLTAAGDETVRAGFRSALLAALEALEVPSDAMAVLLPPPAAEAMTLAGKTVPEKALTSPSEPEAARTIRVGVETLEHLMASASELVLIRNQLIQALRDQPDSPFAAPLHRLNQVTSELQEGVMATRMQPISAAWAKLPRLTRDLAVELGKSIELTLTGQDTELDRQVMERIRDPLNHLIRNAADHGLETPPERRAAGKPDTGRLHLAARHEGGAIVIEMSDDGRGLNLERIRARAIERGLISPADAAAMDAVQTARLVFAPGFSTAEQVSAVSGRGVGMDVVRANIESIGGSVDLSSTPGRGTRVVIRIPMTLSIVSALIVECTGERFALPQAGIVELVGAGGDAGRRIETLDGAAVLRLRDRLLPLINLRETLALASGDNAEASADACIVVARVGGFDFGVLVDRVFDTEEIVVKPLAGALRRLRLYSGATILGDGAVVMILDVKGLAAEIGAEALSDDAHAVDATIVSEPAETLLLFRTGGDEVWGAPLSAVSRLEEVRPGAAQIVDGRAVVHYRDRLTPLVSVDGCGLSLPPDRTRPLLVFQRAEQLIALAVEEIVDIATLEARQDLPASTPGVEGSAIVDGQAVNLLDIDGLWRVQDGRPTRESDTSTAAPPPRLLVVDDGAFTQLMVRPLLARAGYTVEIAATPEAALALHDAGRDFDLILADTATRGPQTRRLASVLGEARRWRDIPLLGLGLSGLEPPDDGSDGLTPGAEAGLLADVGESLRERAA